ncbi:MAG TPA: BrnA antitoxin family protein [Rhodanobacter sp.]|nr:BrnA antitoxin family protein [Rhodanobacter sp.]
MRKEYDFSGGKRGAVLPSSGKTRITIMLDNDVLEYFRERADSRGTGYQTMINAALKSAIDRAKSGEEPLTVAKLREVLRQELDAA